MLYLYEVINIISESINFKLDKASKGNSDISDLDKESKKEMIRVLAIENGLIEDTDREVKNLDEYFKDQVSRKCTVLYFLLSNDEIKEGTETIN